MSEQLVWRMRTCAAALLDCDYTPGSAPRDAADLLAEASNLLDTPEPLGEPMPVLEATKTGPTWTTGTMDLPSATAKPCPSCGNVAARKVRIAGRQLFLTCPMCAHEWEYKP